MTRHEFLPQKLFSRVQSHIRSPTAHRTLPLYMQGDAPFSSGHGFVIYSYVRGAIT